MTINRRDALRLGAAAAAGLGAGMTAVSGTRASEMSNYKYALGESAVGVLPVNHASLYLTLPNLVTAVDPVGSPAQYAELPRPDLVLVTHEHGDHYNAETLGALVGEGTILIVNPAVGAMLPAEFGANALVLANGEGASVGMLNIDAIPAYNTTPERLNYHPEGRDNGYVLTFPGGRIYIAGDTEDIPEMRALTEIDIAFVPMNLPYTMDVDQAAAGVAAFAPKTVFPYHSRGSDIADFAQKVKASGSATEVVLHDWYA